MAYVENRTIFYIRHRIYNILLNRYLNNRQPLFRILLIPRTINIAGSQMTSNLVPLFLHVGKCFGK